MTPEKRSPQPAAGHARAPFRAQGTCAGIRADCRARPRAPRTGPRGSWAWQPGLPALFWLCDWLSPRPRPYEVRCGRSLSFSAPPGSRAVCLGTSHLTSLITKSGSWVRKWVSQSPLTVFWFCKWCLRPQVVSLSPQSVKLSAFR